MQLTIPNLKSKILNLKSFLLLAFVLSTHISFSQNQIKESENLLQIEELIETIAANIDVELDYTQIVDELKMLYENPVNLNSENIIKLRQLHLLNDLQINNLKNYIIDYGNLMSVYELSAIDGFDKESISNILPFISVKDIKTHQKISINKLTKHGRNRIFLRYRQLLEKQNGYSNVDSMLAINPNSKYLGSPQKYYLRYDYNYFNKIRIGFLAEKDPGEIFFKNKIKSDTIINILNQKLKNGFDHYSGYLFVENIKFLKSFSLGDYHLQFGQGLTMWSNLAFGKQADAIFIKKYPRGIKPGVSANENEFFRGAATTLRIKKFDITVFYSNKNINASISEIDTLSGEIISVSSLQNTGMHRQTNELINKKILNEVVYGGNLSYNANSFRLGATAFKTGFGSEILLARDPYKKFTFSGKENLNLGFDFDILLNKMNIFGEIAYSINGGTAYLSGLNINPDPRLSLSILYRNYSKEYQNFFSNAFGENTSNENEKGLYLGMKALLHQKITLTAYFDIFSFSWLKYRNNAPTKGQEYLIQLDYRTSDKVKMYFRYRDKNKQLNFADEYEYLSSPSVIKKQNFRYHLSYTVFPSLILKNRFEFTKYISEENITSQGFMIYQDINFRPENLPFDISVRYAMFDTDNYDTRIYVYENDVLYAFSIPSYYYTGSRFYFLMKYKISGFLSCWFRFAQSFYNNKNTIGTGLEEINGNRKTEIKVQLRMKF
ncbi:hypothetical protein KAU11_11240 [Candidatus Babeliales bacterium]|nr:hypothetical protein [Candidatus Babeliales bacterium]